MTKELMNLIGDVYGEWSVLEEIEVEEKGRVFLCECKCGKQKNVMMSHLRSGRSTMCFECSFVTHGVSKHPLYKTWYNMVRRCYDKTRKEYKNYGGRGITVCERWRESPENFINDIEDKPSPQHSIDRIDNDGNYEPSNCRWATSVEQCVNRRIFKNNKSGYRGVSWDKSKDAWVAFLQLGGKVRYRGLFKNKDDAIKARKEAEEKYFQ